MESREDFGAAYRDNDLDPAARRAAGSREPRAYTSAHRALITRRKLTRPNFHALRHSHTGHMLRNGIDIKEVGAVLPTASGRNEKAARRVDTVLRKALEQAQL